jgi:hypothetical protein
MDDGVREICGCYAAQSNGDQVMLIISEFGSAVWIEANHGQRKLTPDQARHVAAQLTRLANRIDRRLNPEAEIPDDIRAVRAKAGRARADSLSPERRSEIAKDAANKRWGKTSTEQPS